MAPPPRGRERTGTLFHPWNPVGRPPSPAGGSAGTVPAACGDNGITWGQAGTRRGRGRPRVAPRQRHGLKPGRAAGSLLAGVGEEPCSAGRSLVLPLTKGWGVRGAPCAWLRFNRR